MRAAVMPEDGDRLEIRDLDLADPGPGQALVRLVASGVCHSDLHVIEGTLPVPLPAVLGHEGAGIVEAVGPGVTRVQPGDHVVLSWVPSCGSCFYCGIGRPDMCDDAFAIQMSGSLPGGGMRLSDGEEQVYHFLGTSCFAERTVVQERGLVPIRRDVPLDRAALVGCAVTTGYGAVMHTAQVQPGSRVAVIGAGGVGLNVIQTAALAGARQIIVIDRVPEKLALARRFGATDVIDAAHLDDLVTPVLDLTEGRGADYSFEVVGRPETIEAAYGMTRKAGMTVVVGIAAPHEELSLNAFSIPAQSRILTGSWYGRSVPDVDIPAILDLYMQGRLDLDGLISHRYALEEINDAFDAMRRGELARGVIDFAKTREAGA
ncbi:MAG: Zn-dependent alcohol dehydrogenase [Thermaerobacter sp.]|nr:Zn-dependent alcohol dehydrogenase [Thermaerobacter sp.]